MLSRLLEAGPTQFSTPLGFMVAADSASGVSVSAATPVPADSTASATTGLLTSHLCYPKTTAEDASVHRADHSCYNVNISG